MEFWTKFIGPEVDRASTRDMGFIVTDGKDFFSEEKRHTKHTVEYLAEGVPAFRLTNECEQGRYKIEKEIITDPRLDVLLLRTRFTATTSDELYLYVLLAPHLDDGGAHNNAWIEKFWGEDFLLAKRNGNALALGCSAPFLKCSAGYVGVSDGWQDLNRHKRMEWSYPRARDGNVALTAQIDLGKCGGEFVLALGFDSSPIGAAHHVRASLLDGFDSARDEYVRDWQEWQKPLQPPAQEKSESGLDYYRISTAVLHTHQAKKFPGGIVASLSIPWGFRQRRHGSRRLSSGLGARSRAGNRRFARGRREDSAQRGSALSRGHARGGWKLAAKHVGHRRWVLDGQTNG